ncbi:MAG: 3,4-dihydroxy-2-butanone 4-phosphate synthase / GTP cyclohydrolase II, partial [uncultured Solirubrobacteraceae bacterium]
EHAAEGVRAHRGGDRGHPRRADGRRLRRRGPRERGRPHDGRPVRDARGDQLHGARGPGPDLPGPDRGALRRAGPRSDGGQERVAVRDGLHRLDRGARGRHHGDLGRRPRAHHPGRHRSALVAARPCPARARVPAEGQAGRRPRAHGPDRGGDRPRAPGRPQPVRRDLRDHERRRDDGARGRPRALLPAPRPEDGHRGGPDRLPAPARPPRRARRLDRAADRLRRLHGRRLPVAGRRQAPCRDGQGRRARQARRPRARALGVPDRRRLPLAALRLRRAAGVCAVDDRVRGRGRAALSGPGGPRHRAAQQTQGLQPAGQGLRHRRRQPGARPAGRSARLRHRGPDPRRSRSQQHPHPHQQPQEDPRPGGLRTVGERAGPDRPCPQPAQRGVPARQARSARPHAAPSGAAARRGAPARGAQRRGEGGV